MATMRKHYGKWQTVVRIKGHPIIYKSFGQKTDAKRWAIETELKLRREDVGIAIKLLDEADTAKASIDKRIVIKIILEEKFNQLQDYNQSLKESVKFFIKTYDSKNKFSSEKNKISLLSNKLLLKNSL